MAGAVIISKAQVLGIMFFIGLSAFDPSFIRSPTNQTACEGSTIYQQCQISIQKECMWFLNGVRIHVCTEPDYNCLGDFRNGECAIQIYITNSTKHSGSWQCGYDSSGETIKSPEAFLSILKFPVPPKLSAMINDVPEVISQELKYGENDEVELKCTAQCSRTPTNFIWYIDNQDESVDTHTTTTGDLDETVSLYEKLKEQRNAAASLTCGVKHNGQIQESQTAPLILEFQFATKIVNLSNTGRQIVMEGERGVYKCIANGNPPPKCEWLMLPMGATNLVSVQEFGSCNYIIESFSSINEGRYTCAAGNIHTNGHVLSEDTLFLVFGERIRNKVAIVGGIIGGLLSVVIIGLTVTVIVLRRRGGRPKFAQTLPALSTPVQAKKASNYTEREDDYYLCPSIQNGGQTDAVYIGMNKFPRRNSYDSDTIYEEIAENNINLGVLSDSSNA